MSDPPAFGAPATIPQSTSPTPTPAVPSTMAPPTSPPPTAPSPALGTLEPSLTDLFQLMKSTSENVNDLSRRIADVEECVFDDDHAPGAGPDDDDNDDDTTVHELELIPSPNQVPMRDRPTCQAQPPTFDPHDHISTLSRIRTYHRTVTDARYKNVQTSICALRNVMDVPANFNLCSSTSSAHAKYRNLRYLAFADDAAGSIGYMARSFRLELGVECSMLGRNFLHPTIGDARKVNAILAWAKDLNNRYTLRFTGGAKNDNRIL